MQFGGRLDMTGRRAAGAEFSTGSCGVLHSRIGCYPHASMHLARLGLWGPFFVRRGGVMSFQRGVCSRDATKVTYPGHIL